jgi:hypothetical protein
MLFRRFEIRAATGEMAGMHGVTGTVTEIYWDLETHEYRYVLRLDKRQPTPRLVQAVANFLGGESDRPCTVPCGVVFPCVSPPPPPNSKQCLVCAKPSTYTYPSPSEDNGPLLPYCSPACLELHKARHELEGRILAEDTGPSMHFPVGGQAVQLHFDHFEECRYGH